MKGVAPARRERRAMRADSSGLKLSDRPPPRPGAAWRRGRSTGSARTGSSPPSCRRQYSSCDASSPVAISSRCQRAKSAYCSGSGGSTAAAGGTGGADFSGRRPEGAPGRPAPSLPPPLLEAQAA